MRCAVRFTGLFLLQRAGCEAPSRCFFITFQDKQYLEEEALQAVTRAPTPAARFRNRPCDTEKPFRGTGHPLQEHLPSPTRQGPSQGPVSGMFPLGKERSTEGLEDQLQGHDLDGLRTAGAGCPLPTL